MDIFSYFYLADTAQYMTFGGCSGVNGKRG